MNQTQPMTDTEFLTLLSTLTPEQRRMVAAKIEEEARKAQAPR